METICLGFKNVTGKNPSKNIAIKLILHCKKTFSKQISPTLAIHFTASYKTNKKKSAHQFAIKIPNLTQYADFLGLKYNYQAKTIVEEREVLFFRI